jgi:hypothetical protein
MEWRQTPYLPPIVGEAMKKITTDPTPANITTVTDILAALPQRLATATQGLTDERLCHPIAEGERAATEVLAHLINSEARTSEAIYLALLAEEPLMLAIHSEREWGKLLRYDLLPFSELLAYFTLRRRVLLRILASLTDQQWLRVVRDENKQRKESVYWKARGLTLHELDHLDEIERVRRNV